MSRQILRRFLAPRKFVRSTDVISNESKIGSSRMKPTRRDDDRTASTSGSNSSKELSKEEDEGERAYSVGNLLSYVTSCGNRDTTNSESSFLHCGGVGNHHLLRSMQRASVARRSEHSAPAGVRPRSTERPIMPPEIEELNRGSGHCRSMSDPFDTAQFEDAVSPAVTTDEEEDEYYAASMSQLSITSSSEHAAALPTFQRFPCVESRNKNCWSEPPIAIFSIRGATYVTDKVKVPSAPYLLPARGSDVFLTDSKKPFCLSQMYVVLVERNCHGIVDENGTHPFVSSTFSILQQYAIYTWRAAIEATNTGDQLSFSMGIHDSIL